MSDIQTKTTLASGTESKTRRSASVTQLPGRTDIDAGLMARIITASDKQALRELSLHYAPRLKAFLMYRGEQSQTAEDIVQDVIILIWTKAPQFDPQKGSFSSWAYRMTRNKWIDHKRKHGRMQPTAPDIMSVMSDDLVEPADIEFDRQEASLAVRKEMALLPTDQKQILYLAFFEGLSHSQISDRTGLALGTVKSRIRSSLKKMRGGLETFRGEDQ